MVAVVEGSVIGIVVSVGFSNGGAVIVEALIPPPGFPPPPRFSKAVKVRVAVVDSSVIVTVVKTGFSNGGAVIVEALIPPPGFPPPPPPPARFSKAVSVRVAVVDGSVMVTVVKTGFSKGGAVIVEALIPPPGFP